MKQSNDQKYDVVIIGAGPAGIYLALNLDPQIKVLIIDKNSQILKKFLLSGNGKANITNLCSFENLLQNMIFGTKNFMYYAFKTHPQSEIMALVQEFSLPYAFKQNQTKVHLLAENKEFIHCVNQVLNQKPLLSYLLNTSVVSVDRVDQGFQVATTNGVIEADNVVVATGGLSFSKFSGCTGDGYRIAKSFGIKVNKTFPMGISLSLTRPLKQFLNLSGNSIANINAKVYLNKKLIVQETNDLMVTHDGLGGPIIRRISGYVTYYEANELEVYLDLLDQVQLTTQLNQINRLHELWDLSDKFSKKFIRNFYEQLELEPLTDVKNLNKKQKQEIINYFCDIKLDEINRNFNIEQAINTGGGISTKEINPKTFMVNHVPGLFFIGEVLDVNAKTGGFNLTVCYSSASCCADYLNQLFFVK